MIYLVVIVSIALLSSAAIFVSGRGLVRDISDVRQIVGRVKRVNVGAFRQLQDPRDVEFLRSRLSASAFRKSQRLRARAELSYLISIFQNAAILARVAELARATGEAELVGAGTRLLNAAMQVRVSSGIAILTALVRCWWPAGFGSDRTVIGKYEALRDRVAAVALIQCPTESSVVCSAV
jgi:predicted anti-sigma-YlaC factor YlaD